MMPNSSVISKKRPIYLLLELLLSPKAILFPEDSQVKLDQTGLFLVMAFDLLLGQGLRGGGKLRRRVEAKAGRLQKAWRAQAPKVPKAPKAEAFGRLPRYVRVNQLRSGKSTGEVLEKLKEALRDAKEKDLEEGKEVEDEVAEVKARGTRAFGSWD